MLLDKARLSITEIENIEAKFQERTCNCHWEAASVTRGELWRVSDGLSTPGFSEILSLRRLHIGFQDPPSSLLPQQSGVFYQTSVSRLFWKSEILKPRRGNRQPCPIIHRSSSSEVTCNIYLRMCNQPIVASVLLSQLFLLQSTVLSSQSEKSLSPLTLHFLHPNSRPPNDVTFDYIRICFLFIASAIFSWSRHRTYCLHISPFHLMSQFSQS